MAAMNFKNQKFAGGFLHITVSLFLLLVCGKGGLTVNAQGADAGKLYLDRKELDVKEIAANATINNANCGKFENMLSPGMQHFRSLLNWLLIPTSINCLSLLCTLRL